MANLPKVASTSRTIRVTVLAFFAILIFLTYPRRDNYNIREIAAAAIDSFSHVPKSTPIPSTATLVSTRPDRRIIGLIFYGRQDRVSILNCYLERNLRPQGGWLDEVHFVRNTNKQSDLTYLDTLVTSNPLYKIVDLPDPDNKDRRYEQSWELMERDAIYVKIDDDIVWIADDTIPRIVTRKLQEPEYLLVSANNINSPLMSKVHYDTGAYRPYLPLHASVPFKTHLQLATARNAGDTRWRFDHYPTWTGPSDYTLEQDTPTNGLSPVWLRLPNDEDILRTPVRDVTYDTWGPGVKSWSIAAQSHLSLLENIYNENTTAYHQTLDDIWITDYDRLSINLVVVEANEILAHLPVDEGIVDEEWITVTLPKRLGKHVAVETKALASHFSFSFQNAIQYTDILDRYADYAKENACLAPEQLGIPILGS